MQGPEEPSMSPLQLKAAAPWQPHVMCHGHDTAQKKTPEATYLLIMSNIEVTSGIPQPVARVSPADSSKAHLQPQETKVSLSPPLFFFFLFFLSFF